MIIGSSFWNVDETSEVNISFGSEVRPHQRIVGILEDILVEYFVLLLLDFRLVAGPKGLGLIHPLELLGLDSLSSGPIDGILNSLLIDVLSFFSPLLGHLLDLSLDLRVGLFYFFLSRNDLHEVDGIADETAVSLHQSLQFLILTVLRSVFLEVEPHDCSSLQVHAVVLLNDE